MRIILPGLTDIHVHFRTPGQTHKEDFESGTSAAVAGGFTTILDMPNNSSPITTRKRLDEKMKIAREQTLCNIGFFLGSQGNNLDEFEKVKNDVFGIKLYLNETTGNFLINSQTLGKIFRTWHGGPILVHAEDDAVEEVIKNVEQTGKHTHFCHISLQTDLEQIMKAKKKGLPITCGVTPHHLFLTNADIETLGSYGKMKPYLKSSKDVRFLWKHLDQIDVIESDHAPHTKEEKDSHTPPFGVPGLETTLPLLLTAAAQKKITMNDIKRLCSDNPKKIFNIPTEENTYVEIDPEYKYTILNANLKTKCAWSPFEGWLVQGKVIKTVIGGAVVFEDDMVISAPKVGRVIKPNII